MSPRYQVRPGPQGSYTLLDRQEGTVWTGLDWAAAFSMAAQLNRAFGRPS